jgi:hypothetical protein
VIFFVIFCYSIFLPCEHNVCVTMKFFVVRFSLFVCVFFILIVNLYFFKKKKKKKKPHPHKMLFKCFSISGFFSPDWYFLLF